jgi:tRNA threonylcarbamoyladenosine biosynthesis protein TsaE
MEQRSLFAKNPEDLHRVASEIVGALPEERVFALHGKMGAGKTTLIKAFCQVLGVQQIVSSPTFALVNEYSTQEEDPVFHFDFYRIKKIEEVYDIGYEEYFYSDAYCFIEWPEMITNLLPQSFVQVDIEVLPNEERKITYSVISA